MRKPVRKAALYLGLVVGGVAMMIPFLWMLTTSLKTRAEVFSTAPLSFPTGLHWENYTKMWFALPDVTFGTFFQNSMVIASLATIGQLVTCSMAAYAFAVLDFPFKRVLLALILATLIIPFQVVLVPNFILYRYLPFPFSDSGNWIGTNLPLWVWAFFGGAFGTFLLPPLVRSGSNACCQTVYGCTPMCSPCALPNPRSGWINFSPSAGSPE